MRLDQVDIFLLPITFSRRIEETVIEGVLCAIVNVD